MAESNVKLRVDARDAVNALNQTNNASKQLNQTLNTTSKRAGTATANIQRFGISFRSVVGPMVALTGALTLANRSLNTFGKRQADLAVLSAQLERIGAGGSRQLDELREAADRLGDATLFSQDDFIQSFNILSSFRAIAVESFTEVSEVAADIAQVMGSDVKSATVQLAKALEDPKRGLTALSRSGITFNEAQTETIKKLVDSGKLLDAQSLILETIKGQYEGAGTAAGEGFAGALDLLSENAGDAAEALGKLLEPAATDAANALAGVLEQISKIPQPLADATLKVGLATTGFVLLKKAVDAFIGTKLAGVIAAQIAMLNTFGAKIYIAAAAQGALNLAVKGFPVALAALAIGSLIKSLADAKTAQDRFNNAMSDGSVEALKSAIAIEEETISVERNKGAKMSLLGINAKLLKSQQRLTKLRAALAEAEAKPKKAKDKDDSGGNQDPPVKDMSQQLLDLNNQLRTAQEAEQQRIAATLKLMVEKQKISESALGPIEKEDRLQQAIHKFRQKIKKIDKEIADQQAKDIENRTKNFEDQLHHQEQLRFSLEKQNQIFDGIGQTIQDGLVRGIEDAITGAKSLGESLSGIFKSVGGMFLKSAINSAIGGINFGGGGGGTPEVLTSGINFFGAEGGYASGATNAVIGEAGPEYLIPENKMRESMARYSRGVRGSAVIPENGEGGTNGMGGGTAVAAPIDVRYTVERINSVDYVTADQFQRGMQQAAANGAKQGEQRALTTLRQNTSQRRRVGL